MNNPRSMEPGSRTPCLNTADSFAEGIRKGRYRKEPLRREKGKETYRVRIDGHCSLIVKEFGPRAVADTRSMGCTSESVFS